MPKILVATGLAGCLAAGLIAFYMASPPESGGFNADAPPSERLLALESALEEERRARQGLEDELFRLIDEVEKLRAVEQTGAERQLDVTEEREAREAVQAAQVRNRVGRPASLVAESRAEQLMAAGFSPDRAEVIARREAELRMDAMRARFEARQEGEAVNFFQAQFNADQSLRNELGEAEYEQYLEASNRSTSVGINNVLEFSPAEQAGLRPGDRIVRYDGERVFNFGDLNRAQMQGKAGANVVVEIIRDGAPLQVTLPAGPLGVMASRAR